MSVSVNSFSTDLDDSESELPSEAAELATKEKQVKDDHESESNEPNVSESIEPHNSETYEPHCWICRNPFTKTKCSQCVKTYHENCIDGGNYTKVPFETTSTTVCTDVRLQRTVTFEIGICPECAICSTGKYLSECDSGELRTVMLKMCRKLQKHFPYYRNLNELQDVVYRMDTNKIMENVHNWKYNNLEEFLCDVKWIYHNISVYAEAEFKGKTYNEIFVGAKTLLKWCQDDINDASVCYECFPTWADFNYACKKPHVLAWVTNGHNYPSWPAKAYRIMEKKKKRVVLVKFFGDKTTSTVPIGNCYFFNERSSYDKKVADAYKECEDCIWYMEQKFGKVVLPLKDKRQKLLIDMSKCINKMFPDFDKQRT